MKEKRRENRVNCDLPVSVVLRDGFEGPRLAGPAPASLHDISSYGASLIIPQIRFGTHHLFYSSRDHHPTQILFLEIKTEGEGESSVAVPVRPVGFDRVLGDETMPFYIGVEFMAEARDEQISHLKHLALERRRQQKSWWRHLLERIWPPNEEDEDSAGSE